MYYANSDFIPTRPDGIALAENQLVDVLDSHDPEQYLVRTRPRKDERPKIGWVDACYLEKKSTNIGQVCTYFSHFMLRLLTDMITAGAVVVVVVTGILSTRCLTVNDKRRYSFKRKKGKIWSSSASALRRYLARHICTSMSDIGRAR